MIAARGQPRGFSLVELLVVLGILAVLVSLLLPTLAKARREADYVRCQGQMKQIGEMMAVYMGNNGGWLFPPLLGVNVPPSERWTVKVLKMGRLPEPAPDPAAQNPADYTPKYMLCPADSADAVVQSDGSPYVKAGQVNVHTYVLSHNVGSETVKYSKRDLKGLSPAEFIIMGEKNSQAPDYYMGTRQGQPSEYQRVCNFAMHGREIGSNYLHLDLHVEARKEKAALRGIDPWYSDELP